MRSISRLLESRWVVGGIVGAGILGIAFVAPRLDGNSATGETVDAEATVTAFEYGWWERADEMVGESHTHLNGLLEAFNVWVEVASEKCDIRDNACIQGLPEWLEMVEISEDWQEWMSDEEWAGMIFDGPEPENELLKTYRDEARAMSRQWIRELESRDLSAMETLDDEYTDAIGAWDIAKTRYFEEH